MSRSVDKRIVEMDLNNKNFESNAKTSISTIQKLKDALKFDNAEDGFYRVEKAASTVNLNPIINSVDELTSKFNAFGIFGIEVMRRISNAAIDTGKEIWNATIGQIKSGGSARALNIANAQFKLEGLGVAWKEASKDISAAVDGTAYGFDAAANTASQLASSGIELGEAYGGMAHSLKAVSGIAAMTNSSYEQIGYIFAQIAGVGKLMGQDLMQLQQRGIDLLTPLAKHMGVTREEVSKLQSSGKIGFKDFSEAMYEAFGEQAAKANDTFEGAMSNVRAALSRIGEIWYGPFYQAAITPLNKIRVAINQIKKAFDDGDESTEDFKTRLTELMNIVSNIFSWLTENVDLRFFTNIANGANMVLDAMNDIGHAIEKTLGIFKTDKQVEETNNLTASLKDLTEAELQAAKDIWNIGKYGNGQERIDNLLAAGFTEEGARRVQLAINKFIDSNYQWMEIEKKVGEQADENDKKMEGLSQTITSKFVRSFIAARNAASVLGDAIGNVASGVWNIIKMLGSSFVEHFNFELVFKDLESIAYRIRFFTEAFKKFTTGNKMLKSFIDGIFITANNIYRVFRAAASIANTLLNSIITVVVELLSDLDLGEISLGKFSDKIAKWAENLASVVKQSGIFVTILRKIIAAVKDIINYAKDLPNKLQPFFDKTKKNLNNLFDKLKQSTGVDMIAGLKKIKETLVNLFDILSNPFKKNKDGKLALVEWAKEAKDAILGAFSNPGELFVKLRDWFKSAFEKIKSNPKSIVPTKLFETIGHLFSDIIVGFAGIDFNQVAKIIRNIGAVLLIASGVLLALAERKLIKTLTKPVATIKEMTEKVIELVGFFKTLSKKVAFAIEIDLLANSFIKVAAAVAILGATIAGLGMIDDKVLVKGLTAVGACIIALTIAVGVYNSTANPKAIKMFDSTIIQLGLSMGIMAGIIAILGKMDYESLAKGLIMINVLTFLFVVLSAANKMFGGNKNNLYKGIVALAVAVDLMIPFLSIVGKLKPSEAVRGILALSVVISEMTGMMVAMTALADATNNADIVTFNAAVMLLSISIDLLIPFFKLVGELNWGEWGKAVLAFVISLGSIVASFTIFSKLSKGIDSLDIIAFAAALTLMSLGMKNIADSLVKIASINGLADGSIMDAVKALVLILVTIGGGMALISAESTAMEMLAFGVALSMILVAFNALIPTVTTLAKLPTEKVVKATGCLAGLLLTFGLLVAAFAAIDIFTGHAATIVLAAFAAMIGEIAIIIIGGAVAIGAAAVMIGTASVQVTSAVDKFSRTDTSDFKHKMRDIVRAISDVAKELIGVAPDVELAITAMIMAVIGGIDNAWPVIQEFADKGIFRISQFLISGFIGLTTGIATGIVKSLLIVAEWLTDESGGKSILERIGNAIVDVFITVMEVLDARTNEILGVIVRFLITLFTSLTAQLKEHGQELIDAFNEFWGTVLLYMLTALDQQGEQLEAVGEKIGDCIWKGVKDWWNKLGDELRIWWRFDVIGKAKLTFGIDKEDSTGTIYYKAGKTIVKNIFKGVIDTFKEQWTYVENLHKAVKDFLAALWDDLKHGTEVYASEYEKPVADTLSEWEKNVFHDAFGVSSPATDWWDTAKQCLAGLYEGFKDNLGLSEISISGLLNDFQNKLFKDAGLDGEGSFMDKLMGMLGIDDENTFSISPVLDTSDFEKQYSSFANDYGLDTDYNFGSTTSDLGSDISLQTQGGISQSGFTSENVEGLRTDVQDIAERMSRLEVRMDTGALVGALYAGIDEKLGEKQILAGRGVYA